MTGIIEDQLIERNILNIMWQIWGIELYDFVKEVIHALFLLINWNPPSLQIL